MSDLDENFPLGDGVADLTAWIACPYCGEEIEVLVDPGGGPLQEYIEDCEVCCRPLHLTVSWDEEGVASVDAVTDEQS
ncbi:MAG: CPXCG motif-containing cysteine-rich protein [Gemmatimonadota bacterium]